MNIRKTLIRIVLPLIFLYGVFLWWAVVGFGGGCRNKAPETHILPYGFAGKVCIIFNQKEGLPRKHSENGDRLYHIPKSGILKTKFQASYGWIDAGARINFYYQSDDSLTLIDKLITENEINKKLDSNQIVVFDYGNTTRLNFQLEGDVLTYIVDSFKNIDKREEYILTKEKFDNWNQ